MMHIMIMCTTKRCPGWRGCSSGFFYYVHSLGFGGFELSGLVGLSVRPSVGSWLLG